MPYIGNPAVVGDSTNTFKLLDDIQSFTLTFDATDTSVVSISGDTLTFRNHRFLTGQRVTYNDGGGTAIGGLADGVYFIIKVDQNTIQLATNASNAAAGTAINLTSGAAGGSHTLNVAFDGVNTKFSATHSSGTKASISRAAQISLSINGVIQQPQDTGSPTTGYGVLPGSIIIFSTPPASVDKVFGTFIGEVAPSFDLTDNTVDNFTGDGSTTSFNLSRDVPSSNDVLVTLDGVTQYPTDSSATRSYAVIESTLTFVSAPDTGVAIQVRHIGFAGATTSAVTGFYGRQGNVALVNTDDISVQNISGVGATFTSNVNIEGVLTYEDVTNVDSIGIITARAGVLVGSGITLSKDGDVFFTGIATGNGSGLTALNASNLGSGTVPTARLGSGTASSSTFLRGDSSFQTVNTDLVSDTSPQLGGNLDVNTKNIVFGDSSDGTSDDVLKFGAGTDLLIYSDGSTSFIKSDDLRIRTTSNENYITCTADGAVKLYHDNTERVRTNAGGAQIFGNIYSQDNNIHYFGDGNDLQIYHNGSTNIIDAATSNAISFRYGGNEQFFIGNAEFKGADNKKIKLGTGDDMQLYHDGTTNYIECGASNFALRVNSGNRLEVNGTSGDVIMQGSGGKNFTWDTSAGYLNLNDNARLTLGTGNDLFMYHNGSNTIFDQNGTGSLFFQIGGANKFYVQSGGAQFVGSLYGDDNNKIELGDDQDLKIYHNSSVSYITSTSGALTITQSANNQHINLKKATGGDIRI